MELVSKLFDTPSYLQILILIFTVFWDLRIIWVVNIKWDICDTISKTDKTDTHV